MSGHRFTTIGREQRNWIRRVWSRWFHPRKPESARTRADAEAAITRLYELAGAPPPAFSWTGSPMAAVAQVAALHGERYPALFDDAGGLPTDPKLLGAESLRRPLIQAFGVLLGGPLHLGGTALRRTPFVSLVADRWGELGAVIAGQAIGAHDTDRIALQAVRPRGLGVARLPDMSRRNVGDLGTIARCCSWWWPYKGVCVLAEHPVEVRWAPLTWPRRLHNDEGPAVLFPDGEGLWAWGGLPVERRLIERPESITVEEIAVEANAERRRVLIERFGWLRWLTVNGAVEVQRDDYGVLYRHTDGKTHEVTVFVKVRNSTPEPDGRHKDYWLRVPPDQTTARGAVAWTFGLERPEEYCPLIET